LQLVNASLTIWTVLVKNFLPPARARASMGRDARAQDSCRALRFAQAAPRGQV